MRTVVITGLGVVAPCGTNVPAFWEAIREGRSAIGPITSFPTQDLDVTIAAEVKDFEDAPESNRTAVPMDRFARFGLAAAREAIADAGVRFDGDLAARTATIVGTAVGGQHAQEENYRRLYGQANGRVHPFVVPRIMANAAASVITMAYGLTGPTFAVSSACASAAHAIGQGLNLIRAGTVDLAICGGAEACITYGGVKSWQALRILADDTCRPFSLSRRGLVLGEGAGILILESLEHAEARNAQIYGELAGCGMSADAADLVRPSVAGAARAMKLALADAKADPGDIHYVNAHGTGTTANDSVEAQALHCVFGARAARIAVSSTKAVHGHSLGASAALEAVAMILALHHGTVPPTANFLGPAADCDLDCVPDGPRKIPIHVALSNAFGFGGLNAVLVARRI